jgi:outer membrane protein assembly factor BamB
MRKSHLLALFAFLPLYAAAQNLNLGQAAIGIAPTPDDAAPSSSVYVQDSAIALDRMALAQRMEGLKEWGKSAEIYQEIIEKFSDRVVPSHLDDKGSVDQYTSVMTLVNQRLRSWPADGLTVYRTKYELTAQNLLNTARGDNLAPLHEVFTRYFVSDSGKQAGLRLIDAYFELGDFPAATWIGQALLLHPNLEAERAKVLFRVGLAAHYSGDQSLAQSTLTELQIHYADAIGSVGGHDTHLADELKADLAISVGQRTVQASDSADDSWPTAGGDSTRGKISFSAAEPGAKLYSVNLPAPNWTIETDIASRKLLQSSYEQWRDDGKALGILPATDRGELFFQDNARMYAVSVDTGQPLAGWQTTYPAHNGQYVLSAEGSAAAAISPPAGVQLAVTLTDTAVLAVMGLPDTLLTIYNLAAAQDARLVCLDRASGRENWTISARDIPVDALKNLRIGGAPLVAGNNVYLAAIDSKPNGYEDCYVLCFDLASGKYRWSTYVAGAPMAGQTVQNAVTGYTPLSRVPAHLAYAGGRLFVVAGVGAMGAIDAYTGNVDWLNLYREPDDAVNPANIGMMGMGWGGRFNAMNQGQPGVAWNPPSPWALSAPIVHGGNVFVLPTDGKYILVYDAGDGRLIKRLEKSNCCQSLGGDNVDTSTPDTLLGVIDGALVRDGSADKREDILLVATSGGVCAIRWRDYDALRPDATVVWNSATGTGTLRGEPFVTADSVYIPTAHALFRVALRNGKILESYPAQTDPAATVSSWPAGEGPGNVLAVGDHVIVAGDRTVAVYTDMSLARARLDKEVAAAPNDPNAQLHYAEVMLLDNQTTLAMAKLDAAIALLNTQTAETRDIAARDRAFNDSLNFAVRSEQSSTTVANAGPLFDRAAALAASPGQQVNYRLSRARFARFGSKPDLSLAIRLYQEILADAVLRNVATLHQQILAPGAAPSDSDQDMVQAGMACVTAISSIINTPDGAAAYQPFEKAAQKQATAARAAGDPDKLLAIGHAYPNSTVASSCQVLAADIYEANGRTRQAIEVWRDISPLVDDPSQQAIAWEALARNYLKLPTGLPAAASRLAAAEKKNRDAKLRKALAISGGGVIAAGTPIGTAKTRVEEIINQRSAGRENNLPDIGLASSADLRAFRKQFHKIPDPFVPQPPPSARVDKLLVPDQKYGRPDRVIAWTQGKGLSIYPVGAQEPVGINADVMDEPHGAAWIDAGNGLLVWTANQVFLISAQQGETRWKLPIGSLPVLDVLAESAPQQHISLINQITGRGGFGRNRRNGLMPVRDTPFQVRPLPQTGGVNPQALTDETASADAGSEQIIDLIPLSDSAVVHTSGGRVMSLKLADGSIQWDMRLAERTLDRVLASDDFVVVKSGDDASEQLVVLDSDSGRMVARQLYTIGAGLEYPINLALGNDGSLAYTTPEKILVFDLFNVGEVQNLGSPRLYINALPDRQFESMKRPDQLAITDDQILALCADGKLRGFSASSGEARTYIQDHVSTEMSLSTGQQSDQTVMRIGDHYVYAYGPSAIVGYNLDKPEISWGDPQTISAAASSRQFFLGRDYALVLSPASDGADPSAAWTMWAFARTLVPGKSTESGLMIFDQPPVDEPHGITAFQAVEGGLVYLSGDHVLHYLKGNTHPAAPPQ